MSRLRLTQAGLGRLVLLPSLVLSLLLTGALDAPRSVAAIVPNPDEALIAHWEPCEPGTGVTVVVDRFGRLGDGKVYVRCALGPQPNGWQALLNAGFGVEGLSGGIGFACRIDGLPTPAEEACVQTPGFDSYWSYWHGKPGGRWGYSGVGATNPMSAAPVDAVQGWSFGGQPRIEPMNGSGPSAFVLPPAQESSVVPAVLARDWLVGVTVETVAMGEEAGSGVTIASDDVGRLLTQVISLRRAGADPAALQPLAELLARSCEVAGQPVGGCVLRTYADPNGEVGKQLPERYATVVLALQALGQDPSSFAGMDLRGHLTGLIDETTGKVSRQGKLQDAVEFTAQTVEALALTGALPPKAAKTVGLILAKQNATTGAFAVGSVTHTLAIRALAAAREDGAGGLDEALARAGAFLEALQEDDGGVRRRENTSAIHNPNLESTAAGAVGLALTGRTEAAERAAKWVSRFQVTAEYAGRPDPVSGDPVPAEDAIGAFLVDADALRTALAFGVPTNLHGPHAEAQLPTAQALLALVAAGPYGPFHASLDQEALQFDALEVGSHGASQTVVLTNRDVRPFAIATLAVIGGAAADFGLDATGCAASTLDPGESCEFSTSFAPAAPGIREAVVEVELDTGQLVGLPVAGTAVAVPDAVPGPDPEPDPEPQSGSLSPLLLQSGSDPPPATASIAAAETVQSVGSDRVARIATLVCPEGSSCAVRTPWRVRLRIGGRYYGALVLAPGTLEPGEVGELRVRLAERASLRLAGRSAFVTVRVRIGSGGGVAIHTARVRIEAG